MKNLKLLLILLLISITIVGCNPDDRVFDVNNEFKVVAVHELEPAVDTRRWPYSYRYIVRDGSTGDNMFSLYSDTKYAVGDIIAFEVKTPAQAVLEK
jgi:hypothetical protein